MTNPQDEFVNRLDECSLLLRAHSQVQWADWLARDAALVRRSDFFGVEHCLAAFGGMGSINDICLADSVDQEKLKFLLGDIYDRANILHRAEDDARSVRP